MISSRHRFCVPDTPCPLVVSDTPVTLVKSQHEPVYYDKVTRQLVREKNLSIGLTCGYASNTRSYFYFVNLPAGFQFGCGYEASTGTPPLGPSSSINILTVQTDVNGRYVEVDMNPEYLNDDQDNFLWIWVSKTAPGVASVTSNPATAAPGTLSFFLIEIYAWSYDILIVIPVAGCAVNGATVRSGDICIKSVYDYQTFDPRHSSFQLAFGFNPSPLLPPPPPLPDGVTWSLCCVAPPDNGPTQTGYCNYNPLVQTRYCGFTNTGPFTLICNNDTSGTANTGYSISEYQSPWPSQTKLILYPGDTQWIALPTNSYSYYIGYKVWYSSDPVTPPTPSSPDGWGYAGFLGMLFSSSLAPVATSSTTVSASLSTAVFGGTPNELNIGVLKPSPALPAPSTRRPRRRAQPIGRSVARPVGRLRFR